MENKQVNILALIITYNGSKWIVKCLQSILESSTKCNILVIDNASNDGTPALIKILFPEVEVIDAGKNLGFGKANNIGLKYALEADADYVFLLNQDAWIEPDTIKKLVDFQKANQQFGIISPIQLNGKGDELDKNFSKYITLKSISKLNESIEREVIFEETNFVNAAAWLISKNCLNVVGGFDPLFLHYGEDRDYCYRATYLGFKIGVLFNVYIFHDRIYQKNNLFRKEQNRSYACAIAHLKNPKNKLVYNYFTWFIIRIKKNLKYLFCFQYKKFINEIVVLYKIVLIFKDVKQSRFHCCTSRKPFLN